MQIIRYLNLSFFVHSLDVNQTDLASFAALPRFLFTGSLMSHSTNREYADVSQFRESILLWQVVYYLWPWPCLKTAFFEWTISDVSSINTIANTLRYFLSPTFAAYCPFFLAQKFFGKIYISHFLLDKIYVVNLRRAFGEHAQRTRTLNMKWIIRTNATKAMEPCRCCCCCCFVFFYIENAEWTKSKTTKSKWLCTMCTYKRLQSTHIHECVYARNWLWHGKLDLNT